MTFRVQEYVDRQMRRHHKRRYSIVNKNLQQIRKANSNVM